MIATCQTSLASPAQTLTGFDQISLGNFYHAQMPIQREQAKTMVEDDTVSINAEVIGKHHSPAIGRFDRAAGHRSQVEPLMSLAINNLSSIIVAPPIGELCLRLGSAELDKRFSPKGTRGGFVGQLLDESVVDSP